MTFHLVCFSWIFFRAGSLGDALDAVRLLASGLPATVTRVAGGQDIGALLYIGQGQGAFLTALGSVVVGAALRFLLRKAGSLTARPEEDVAPLGLRSAYARTAVYALLLYGVLVLGTKSQSFLYTQF